MAMRHTSITTAVGLILLLSLTGCNGQTIEQAFSADPNANRWSNDALPPGFPQALRYPQAQLQTTPDQRQANSSGPLPAVQQTRWSTSDSSAQVQKFYQDLFQGQDWQLVDQNSTQSQSVLTARQKDLQVKVTIEKEPQAENPGGASPAIPAPAGDLTQFQIDYGPRSAVSNSPTSSPQGQASPITEPSQSPALAAASTFDDLDQVSVDLQPYVNDLAQLEILTPGTTSSDNSGTTRFEPNQIITRGTFARWLVEVNNRIYQDRPTQQIRVAAATTTPAFQDVSASDPLFPYIQGLADAGYIPSKLTGDGKESLFKPQQPLTRETLLAWKVPVDLRKILPTATAAKIQQVWGFKDASRVSPQAVAAVLADHQNGELANVRRLVGSALLFQPQKPVTRAEAAAALWFIGKEGEGFSAKDVLRAERQAASTPSDQVSGN
jgi:hypothetical protein